MKKNCIIESEKRTINFFWDDYRDEVLSAPIFTDMDDDEVLQALDYLQASWRKYHKEHFIIKAGDRIDRIGLLLDGSIEISRQDIMGNQFILTNLDAPSLFAEVLACAAIDTSPVTIKAMSDTVVLLLNLNNLLIKQDIVFSCREKLISNVLRLLARKNLMLNDKLDIMSKRSLRAKVAAMLLDAANSIGSDIIKMPYNRQAMADFLAVDRSSLSRELGRMQKEGLISFHRQTFTIINFTALTEIV